ncbi:hypothetical protein EDD69_11369 [Thermolongibacillus altinsuensis]|uniref:Uncharacterized protein n=1 Tax=Thermolongibacillus altinsuensis TaxID=575256 RepID=A0A4R1QBH2_9BACL|nr:hypothetical protein [Thermolongibacillus altinsuensis]TCL47063.1 hypothetical protein EDD69_11369 [Thermolongibacillus altinsuensis]
MKGFFKLFIGLFFAFSLTGCIGEHYDFTPPSVSLDIEYGIQSIQLKEANINWNSDKHYEKETKDILSLARKQKQVSVKSGQEGLILFDSEDFKVLDLRVWLWQKDKKMELKLDKNRNFYFPKEKGEYLIEVGLRTDSGSAQYVGNIVIE